MNDTKAMQFFIEMLNRMNEIIRAYDKNTYKISLYYNNDGLINTTEYSTNSKLLFNHLFNQISYKMMENTALYDCFTLDFNSDKNWIGVTIAHKFYKDYSIELFYEENKNF